jgi:hypothetical protein
MTAEALVRLYNIAAFNRTVVSRPSHYAVRTEIDGVETRMTLGELEAILGRNKDRLAIVLRQQKPAFVNSVVQPYAKAS